MACRSSPTELTSATGEAAANFAGYVPRTYNWGISLTREKYSVKANWNYRGRLCDNAVAGRGIQDGTFVWNNKRLYLDVTGEFQLTRNFALFGKLRNMNDEPQDNRSYLGPNTPRDANFLTRVRFGSVWTFGLRGRF